MRADATEGGRAAERILLADHTGDWRAVLDRPLTGAGFRLDCVADAAGALRKARDIPYALILLDLMNGRRDGLAVCGSLRNAGATPIIVVTACDDDETRLRAFAAGADDYQTAPINPRELVARMRAVLRRTRGGESGRQRQLPIGEAVVDLDGHALVVGTLSIGLQAKELAVLAALARRGGAVVSRHALLDDGWDDGAGDPRAVDASIQRLRKRLAPTAIRIETVWGIGYRLRVAGQGDATGAYDTE